jgi:murein tripeptide amidase MpaA
VFRGGDDRHLLLADRPEQAFLGERAGVLRQAADDDVERPVAQQFDQPVAGVDDDFERDERVGLFHFEQGVAQVIGQGDHDAADVNLLRAAEAQLVQLLA